MQPLRGPLRPHKKKKTFSTRIQAQSLVMRVSLSWGPRLGLLLRWRALLNCFLGRICLLFGGLGLIRGRTLKNPEQFLLRRRIKLKRNPHQLALKNQKNRDLRISNLANHWNLLRFPLDEIFFRWYREKSDNIFRITIADLGIKGDEEYIDGLVRVLSIAGDVLRETREGAFDKKQYYKNLTIKYNGYFRNTPDAEKPSIYKFDNYLYCWALKIWPRALDTIRERCRL